MPDDALHKETFQLSIDRSIFGIQEDRSDDELSSPAWLELEMDEVPVRVTRGAIRIMSLVGTHRPLVTVEVRKSHPVPPPSEFERIGHGRYLTYSGSANFFTIDGPHASFSLAPNGEYELNVWRKGGETARERHDELLGRVYPIEGLEEYLIQFIEQ
ncbi:hypothetical protein ACWGVR_10250 [Streptomyces xanthophaeus]